MERIRGTGCGDDIWRGFYYDPDSKVSLPKGMPASPASTRYVGPTYGEAFKAMIRMGIYASTELPNRVHFVILNAAQVDGSYGRKWLKLFYDEGFEFIRCVDNSVYSKGAGAADPLNIKLDDTNISPKRLYVFMLMRNIGRSKIPDPYTPPAYWQELAAAGHGVPTAVGLLTDEQRTNLAEAQSTAWRKIWDSRKTEFYVQPGTTPPAAKPLSKNLDVIGQCPCDICETARDKAGVPRIRAAIKTAVEPIAQVAQAAAQGAYQIDIAKAPDPFER